MPPELDLAPQVISRQRRSPQVILAVMLLVLVAAAWLDARVHWSRLSSRIDALEARPVAAQTADPRVVAALDRLVVPAGTPPSERPSEADLDRIARMVTEATNTPTQADLSLEARLAAVELHLASSVAAPATRGPSEPPAESTPAAAAPPAAAPPRAATAPAEGEDAASTERPPAPGQTPPLTVDEAIKLDAKRAFDLQFAALKMDDARREKFLEIFSGYWDEFVRIRKSGDPDAAAESVELWRNICEDLAPDLTPEETRALSCGEGTKVEARLPPERPIGRPVLGRSEQPN